MVSNLQYIIINVESTKTKQKQKQKNKQQQTNKQKQGLKTLLFQTSKKTTKVQK